MAFCLDLYRLPFLKRYWELDFSVFFFVFESHLFSLPMACLFHEVYNKVHMHYIGSDQYHPVSKEELIWHHNLHILCLPQKNLPLTGRKLHLPVEDLDK